MPKKFSAENSKAIAAKARKDVKKVEDEARKQKEADELYWKDENKKDAKKQQRKDDEDHKRQVQFQRKVEAKQLFEKEISSIASTSKKSTVPSTKVTRAQIEKAKEKAETKASAETAIAVAAGISKVVVTDELPIEENVNRLDLEQSARSVDEAIAMLSKTNSQPDIDSDAHPERRMKAAYTAYADRRVQELKVEHPSLRLSQLKQMVFKDWQRAPENPMRNKD